MVCVFTGPPCGGKSSVYTDLKKRTWNIAGSDFEFFDEVARESISWFKAYEPDKLPWVNREFFQNYVETIEFRNYMRTSSEYVNILDRCLIDEMAYRQYFHMDVPQTLRDKCLYHEIDAVFYFPLWEEIYKQDSERIETLEQARLLDQLIRQAYAECNIELIEVPKLPVEERTQFILDEINKRPLN